MRQNTLRVRLLGSLDIRLEPTGSDAADLAQLADAPALA